MVSHPPAGPHLCFIVSSLRPYCFDFNEILALPAGFKYRNRFQTMWVEADLRQQIGPALAGRRVLVALRDADNNLIVPMRWGTITSAEPVGDIAYFEYLLGGLVKYSNPENVRQQEVVAYSDKFSQRHAWLPGAPGEPFRDPAVFWSDIGNTLGTADAGDLTAWGNAVAALVHAPAYRRIEFLKIVGLYAKDGSVATVQDESYLVAPNSVYTLKVFQFVPDPGPEEALIPPHAIKLNTFDDHIIALRRTQQAVGKYDMLKFVLRVRTLAPGERTEIEIPHCPDAATEGKASTSLYIPVEVRQLSRLRVTIAAVTALVSLYLMFRPQIGEFPADVVRNLATIVFVLVVTGPARVLASIWPHFPWRSER